SEEVLMIRERERSTVSGIPFVAICIVAVVGAVWLIVAAIIELVGMANQDMTAGPFVMLGGGVLLLIVVILLGIGLFMVAPNEARLLQLFGDYVGTVSKPGLHWANPFFTKRKVSKRIRNFDSDRLKVNDLDGSPIEIAAV